VPLEASSALELAIGTNRGRLPIAVFFGREGDAVFRVSSAQAADLRRFLHRHTPRAAASTREPGPAGHRRLRTACTQWSSPG
jgi:hypothetical protein